MRNPLFARAARGVVCAAAILLWSAAATAQPYPGKPIRMLIPYTPGGPTDLVGRWIAQRLQAVFGQQVVVDNRAGGGGVIAVEIAARAAPDGHTLLLATPGQLVILPLLMTNLPFDTQRDFMPLTKLVDTPQVLIATAKLPAANMAELIAYAKPRPGQLSYGSVQAGGTGHLGMELLKQAAGIDMVHVPYKGTALALTDLIAGQIQVLFNNAISTVPFIKSGQTRALAVTSLKRMQALPDLPSLDETGIKGYDNSSWSAVAAPAGTPKDIIAKLNTELNQILKLPDVQEKNASFGADPVGGTPEQYSEYLKSEIAKFARVVKEAKISAQ